MSRPIWKGSIAFGLVNIPVTLHSGEQRHEMSFHLLDRRDRAHIRYKKINEVTGKEVSQENIVKGYAVHKDDYVLLEDTDFQAVAVENTKAVEITDFVGVAEIDPQYFDRPYYLVPEKAGLKGYVLLRDTLKQQKRVGIAKVVIRSKESLACVMPQGDALQMILLRFSEELKSAEEAGLPARSLDSVKVSDKELAIAAQLVDSMTADWDPEQYIDGYQAALKAYVDKKYQEGDRFEPPEPVREKPVEPKDMMELLQQSLAARQSPARQSGSATARKTAARATRGM